MTEESSVQVAVRMRPMNRRERRAKSTSVIRMSDTATVITHPTSGKVNKFAYDYNYPSDDPDALDYASQEQIFEDIGAPVVHNLLEGYNCCIFAYGQTSAGKSYTMVGDEARSQPGLIPRICQYLMSRAAEGDKIEVSFLEIYAESIKDLLAPEHQNLQLRNHPKTGVYVEDLTQLLIETPDDARRLMERGVRERVVASTKLNNRSSRSHAVFTLYYTKITGKKQVMSKVNLVDLAGSEKVKDSGVTGVNLREAIDINKSLHTLGLVISKLGEKRRDFVPFRDSALTWLLRESLGGNSKTIMFANVSPASVCYSESLSTLRYAASATKIVNVVSANAAASNEVVNAIRDEVKDLRQRLSEVESKTGGASAEIAVIRDKIVQREKIIEHSLKTWRDKHAETVQYHRDNSEEIREFLARRRAAHKKRDREMRESRKETNVLLCAIMSKYTRRDGVRISCELSPKGGVSPKDRIEEMKRKYQTM